MVDIPAMLYRLMDRRGPYANAIHIYTNTMHGDVKRGFKTMTHNNLIGGAMWAGLTGVINWESSEAPETTKTTLSKLDCRQ